MSAPTIRCPLCEWTYTPRKLPSAVEEGTLLSVFDPSVTPLNSEYRIAAETEANLQAHFQGHSPLTWLRKVTALQAQIETQQAELAMLREKEMT